MANQYAFSLEDRSSTFAADVRLFVRRLPRTISNFEDIRQLVRSSGSVGANYIEANEALGQKDFIMKLRISRKEAKEAMYWLKLLDTQSNQQLELERLRLTQEAKELRSIFSSMILKRRSLAGTTTGT